MRYITLAAIICFTGCMLPASAEPATPTTVVSTFGPGNTIFELENLVIGSPNPSDPLQSEWAASFTPSASYSLDNISIAVQNVSGPNQLTVYIASGLTQPGSPIESFSLTDLPSAFPGTVETVTSASNPTLVAGTQYWIVISAADLTNTDDGWALGLTSYSGESLESDAFGSPTWSNAGPFAFPAAFSVVGTSITPEPGTNALCLGGLGLFCLVRRRYV